MKYLFFILTIASIFYSCKKDSLSITSHWQCNPSQQIDSTVIVNKLYGSWIWKNYTCGDNSKVHPADKTVKITFNPNGSLNVVENNNIVMQGNWKIKITDANLYWLDVSQASPYLYGRILFCGNELLFNDSYRDGCDHLFIKNN